MQLRPLYTDRDRARFSGAPSVRPEKERGRTAFKKDYARLLHAASFRRLQGKTQLFPGYESDFFRNRLTHSLEVAQIASCIAAAINIDLKEKHQSEPIDLDLVEFASLAHDLGHPPFGHNGEEALDTLMRSYGGFEGNAQTLHILVAVEQKLITLQDNTLSGNFGLDLTARSLAAVLKYDQPIRFNRKGDTRVRKGYYASEADLVVAVKKAVAPRARGKIKTVECAIMDIADDIAYSTYDLEDSLHADFLTPAQLMRELFHNSEVRISVLNKTNGALKDVGHESLEGERELLRCAVVAFENQEHTTTQPRGAGERTFADAIAYVSSYALDRRLVEDTGARTEFTAERVGQLVSGVEFEYDPVHPALSTVRLSRESMIDVEILKHLNYETVIRSPRLAIPERRGKGIVERIFKELVSSEGALMPSDWKSRYKATSKKAIKMRIICDFVAGMTDRYAVEFHDALFGAGKTIFKPT